MILCLIIQQGQIHVSSKSAPAPPFWQINHANSAYFSDYISHPAPPFWISAPPAPDSAWWSLYSSCFFLFVCFVFDVVSVSTRISEHRNIREIRPNWKNINVLILPKYVSFIMIVGFVLYIVILSLIPSKALIFVVKTDDVVSWFAWAYLYSEYNRCYVPLWFQQNRA